MAEGQRRRILDTGLGANILSTLTGSVSEQIQKRREAQEALKMVFQKVLAEEQAKNQFDPERLAKLRLLTLSEEESQPQFGAGQIGPPTAGQSLTQTNRLRQMEILKGLVGSSQARPLLTPEDFYNRRQAQLQAGIDLVPEREEEKQRLSASGARGTQQVKYEDLVKQFSFISKDVDSVLGFLDKIPAGRVAGPGAQVGAVFGMKGSENVLQYTRTKDLILSKIAKTFGGEVGVLTEGDIQRISKGFPAIWMNDRERETATTWVKDYIQRRIDEYSQSRSPSLTTSPESSATKDRLRAKYGR